MYVTWKNRNVATSVTLWLRREQEILMVMRLRDVSSLVASFQQGAEEVWEEVLVLFQ